MQFNLLLTFIFIFGYFFSYGQSDAQNKFIKNIKPVIGIQFWSIYSMNQKVYDPITNNYLPVDDRFENQIRRSRLGVKGDVFENLSFNVTGAMDLVGKDVLSSTFGGVNNGPSPSFRIWNMYVRWKVNKDSEKLHFTFGYQTPTFSRESIIGAFDYVSFDKSVSQFYIRRQLVGTNPGRAMGLNIGGLFYKENRTINFNYDLGIFSPVYHSFSGNSTGIKNSLLFVARTGIDLGDAERTKYESGYIVNYFGKRKGISLSFSAAHQGNTDLFDSSTIYSADLLINYNRLNIDGEIAIGERSKDDENSDFKTGYIRTSYNIKVSEYILEPTIMYTIFKGANTLEEQKIASSLHINSGKHNILEFGLNFYVNTKTKLSLFYHKQDGDIGELPLGATPNDYFIQNSLGSINRGDFIGFGLGLRY